MNNKDFDGKNRAEWNDLPGRNERCMKEAMPKYSGIEEIPNTVSFSP